MVRVPHSPTPRTFQTIVVEHGTRMNGTETGQSMTETVLRMTMVGVVAVAVLASTRAEKDVGLCRLMIVSAMIPVLVMEMTTMLILALMAIGHPLVHSFRLLHILRRRGGHLQILA